MCRSLASARPGGGASGQRPAVVSDVSSGPRMPADPDDFYARVYDLVRQVPAGRVTTYGRIARALRAPRASRGVGWALKAVATAPTGPAGRWRSRATGSSTARARSRGGTTSRRRR